MARGLRTLCIGILVAAAAPARAGSPTIWQALGKTASEVNFEDDPFEEVLDWLRQQGVTNVVVDWAALNASGIDRDSRIALQLTGLSVGDTLDEVLRQLGDGSLTAGERPAYSASARLLRITTRDRLARRPVVRVYDVTALLSRPVYHADAPEISVTGGGQGGTAGGTGGGAGSTSDTGGGPILTPGSNAGGQIDFAATAATSRDALSALLLQIRPETWRANGLGGSGSIAVMGNRLIITQSLEMHEIIGGTCAGVARHEPGAPTLAIGASRSPESRAVVVETAPSERDSAVSKIPILFTGGVARPSSGQSFDRRVSSR